MRRAAALAALALAAAGCGGAGSRSASGDPIAQAAAKTSHAGSLKADISISGSSVSGTGSGVFDNDERGTGRLTLAVRTQGQSVTVDTIMAGTVIYMRSDVFRQAGLPPGKEWVRLDLARLAQEQGVDVGSLASSNPSPSGGLAYLRGSGGEVEKVGGEKVQGVDTTHYKTTIDLERAAARASGRARDSIRRVIRVSGVKRIPVEAWIDGDGYVRKMVYMEHTGRRQSAKVTMELHDFGPHVAIASPPSSTVIDFQDLLQPQGG
ncbi:MAG TPA: hypothetical protein VE753_06490 [Gaiellaceae bacterium]|jgi:hypothetical protein|nr:hypothetical protein [Gaiellaceae bacterium]